MKISSINSVNFGNKSHFPANHEEMQKRAYNEIYKRVMAGENGPFVIDYYHGKGPKITNIGKEKQGFFKTLKNTFKKILKK